jgi:hypothetical protein
MYYGAMQVPVALAQEMPLNEIIEGIGKHQRKEDCYQPERSAFPFQNLAYKHK